MAEKLKSNPSYEWECDECGEAVEADKMPSGWAAGTKLVEHLLDETPAGAKIDPPEVEYHTEKFHLCSKNSCLLSFMKGDESIEITIRRAV